MNFKVGPLEVLATGLGIAAIIFMCKVDINKVITRK